MLYITNAQFLQNYDKRRVGQWLSDDDTPLTESQILSSTILIELVRQASAMINQACRVGSRYSVEQLESHAQDDDTGGDLRRLCADLTYGLLARRRGYAETENNLAPAYYEALSLLDQLRLGERIFDIELVPEAGLPDTVTLGLNVTPEGIQIGQNARFFGRTITTTRGNGGNGCGCGGY